MKFVILLLLIYKLCLIKSACSSKAINFPIVSIREFKNASILVLESNPIPMTLKCENAIHEFSISAQIQDVEFKCKSVYACFLYSLVVGQTIQVHKVGIYYVGR